MITLGDLRTLSRDMTFLWNTNLPKNKDTITGYMSGLDYGIRLKARPEPASEFEPAPEPKRFTSVFFSFLEHTYKIKHISWQAQVDTYAFRNNLTWYDAFSELFRSLIKAFPEDANEDTPISILTESFPKNYDIVDTETIHIDSKQLLDSVMINEQKIQKGTIIQLADLVGEDYKKTIHYDLEQRDPSWELYNPSEKDFQHIRLCIKFDNDSSTEQEPLSNNKIITIRRAARIFSNLKFTIKQITHRNNKYYAYTDFFEIEIEAALHTNEVKIINEPKETVIQWEKNFTSFFYNAIDQYVSALIPKRELLIDNLYWFLIDEGHRYLPWVNYYFSFGGWMVVKDNIPYHRLKSDNKQP